MFGTTLRTEGGRFAPSKRIEIWWNTLLPGSIGPGVDPKADGSTIRLLGVVRDTRRCHLRTTFAVPEVPLSEYPIRVFVFYRGGYGWFGRLTFEVK